MGEEVAAEAERTDCVGALLQPARTANAETLASRHTLLGCLIYPFTLKSWIGCGSWGGNSISENLDYKHLMNVSRIGKVIGDKPVPTDEEVGA